MPKKLNKLLETFIRLGLTVFYYITSESFELFIFPDDKPGFVKNEQEGI